MDGAVGTVGQQVSLPLVVRPATTQPDVTRPRSESPMPVARTEDTTREEMRERMVKTVELANTVAEFLDRRVSFVYDKRINLVVVKVIRESTEEVVRQIPPEEMVTLMAKLREDFRGLLLNHTS